MLKCRQEVILATVLALTRMQSVLIFLFKDYRILLMALDKMEDQQPSDFALIPLDHEKPYFITQSFLLSFLFMEYIFCSTHLDDYE